MTTMAPQQQQQGQIMPGAAFDIPGVPGGATQWTEQDETTTNAATTHSSAAQVPIAGILPFRQTDVVTDWFLFLNVAQTYTAGTSTLTASAYAPYNLIGPSQILVQNQYASVSVESGIDLYIFNLLRPHADIEQNSGINLGANPAGDPVGGTATGYATTALAQANNINAAQWSTGTTAFNIVLRLPAAQWFDRYYDLRMTGEPTTQPHPALVSPQYMAGTTRVITPSVQINPGNAATTDLGPVNIGAGTGTYAGSSTARFRRKAIYAAQKGVLPPVYAWQYSWRTQRQGIGGQSSVDLILPLTTGQLLGCYVRLFDPAANGALGAPINVNTVTRINLQYGAGLFWFDGQTRGSTTAAELMQRRWFESHASLLPQGVFAFDLAYDDRGQMTNARALNTLTTSGILIHIDFTAPVSSSTYAVIGTESLVYVT